MAQKPTGRHFSNSDRRPHATFAYDEWARDHRLAASGAFVTRVMHRLGVKPDLAPTTATAAMIAVLDEISRSLAPVVAARKALDKARDPKAQKVAHDVLNAEVQRVADLANWILDVREPMFALIAIERARRGIAIKPLQHAANQLCDRIGVQLRDQLHTQKKPSYWSSKFNFAPLSRALAAASQELTL